MTMTDFNYIASPLTATAVASVDHEHPFDDELAATQQSILEELHTISEEALMGNANQHGSLVESCPDDHRMDVMIDHQQAESVDGDTSTRELLDSRTILRRYAEPSEIWTPQKVTTPSPSASQTIEPSGPAPSSPAPALLETEVKTSVADSIAESHTVTNGAVGSGSSIETQCMATVAALELLPPQPSHPGLTHLSESVDAAPHAGLEISHLDTSHFDAEVELTHTDLFDGIEADAFDDIELSPPTRRAAVLPLQEGNHALPASPTRSRNQMSVQSLESADNASETNDATDAELPQIPAPSQMASFLDPTFVGFVTGKDRKQIKLSDKALQAARKLMLEIEESSDLLPPATASQPSPHRRVQMTDASSLMTQHPGDGPPAHSMLDRAPMQEIMPRQDGTALNGSDSFPAERKGKAVVVQRVSDAQAAAAASQMYHPPFETPKPTRSSLLSTSQSMASPMRAPAVASGSRFSTPQPSKRISLGVSPRVQLGGSSTGRKRSLPRFVPPFIGGKRPRGEDLQDPASPLRRQNDAVGAVNQVLGQASTYPPTRTKETVTSKGPAVFEMQSNGPRHKLAEFGRPEYYSSMQMIAKGVPDEVLVILNDASRAAQYAFEAPNGTLLMQKQAFEELRARGCSNVEMSWVQNHWTLILWKLAAMVRFEPSSAPERWSWTELIRQLLYRYEREIHLAQRSCLKRIQERDSSAARPMVLFVSKIFEEDTEVLDRSGAMVPCKTTILELSDGWYRIQATIDSVLTNACQRGRLRIGQKLAITGAMLDTKGEGKDVLSAYHMSNLALAANSVSLARWDAKLGFASRPFCASARSLSPEGGLVSLMDVVIDKVFPRAYVDVDRSAPSAGAPRGEQEEAEEREAYNQRREDAIQRLELEMEAENRRLYDLVEALSYLTGDSFLPTIPDDPNGRLEALANQLFEQLIAQPNPAAAVNEKVVAAGHKVLVPWLHNFAKSAILNEDGLTGSRMIAKLDEMCPPRKVREFRVVRLKDARLPPPVPQAPGSAGTAQQAGNPGARLQKRNPHARTVKLNVWDAAELGDELREGRRFLVTNLVPASKSAWRKPDDEGDIFLSTRRDTKWRALS